MAEAFGFVKGNKVDDLTICSICYEVYKDPKSLPLCLHTFCKCCISSYAASVLQSTKNSNDNKSELWCPICRKKYEVTDVTKWVDGLPNHHVIGHLIDRVSMEKLDNECNSCKRREKESLATNRCLDCCDNLCEDCTCYHKGHRYSMDHTVLKLEELSTHKHEGLPMFCKKHKSRKLEVYCFDHEEPYCLMCATLEHRKCKQVESLEECSKQCTDEKLTSFRQRLDMLCRRSRAHLEHLHKDKNNFHSNVSLIIDRIRCNKEKAIQFLHEKEATICSEIRSIEKSNDCLYNDKESQTQQIQCTSESSLERINNASMKNRVELFLEMKEVEKQCKGFESKLDKIIHSEKYMVRMIEDETFGNFIQTRCPFGRVSAYEMPKANLQSAILEFSGNIEVEQCRFTDVCSYGDNHILAVSEDKNVYIFSKSGKLEDKTMLSGKPWALTKFLKKNVAVSIRSPKYCIHIFEIKSKMSSFHPQTTKMITLEFEPLGIEYEENKFIVSSKDSLIRWIADDGAVMRTLLVSEGYISGLCCQRTLGILCYSNESKKEVKAVQMHCPNSLCFTQTQDLLKLKQPVGLCCDSQDNIYIVGHASHNVVQLKPDGTFVRELIHDVGKPNPIGIWVAETGDTVKLFLTFQNEIKMYNFKF